MASDRKQCMLVTGVLNGHCMLRRHLHNMDLSECPKYRKCEQEKESSYHILCQCSALARHRLAIFSFAWLEPIDTVKCQYNEIVRVTKLHSLNEILLHWNTLKMSHRCLHRRFSRVAAIESNESIGPLCSHLHWSIRVTRPLNSWPSPKLKMFTLSLVISIPLNRNCDKRAGECGYVTSIFIF
jgi:hypothetical protein